MKNTARILNIGIIGCGSVTETFHLPSLNFLKNVNVFGLSDIDGDSLNKLAGRFRIINRYLDPYDLINHPHIEAIALCVPAEFQFSLGMSILTAGKHLFIEKPVTLSLEEIDILIKKTVDTSLKAFVGFNLRWHRNVQKAKATIEKGILGPIELVRSAITTTHTNLSEWRKKREHGGGTIIDLAVHHFDLLCYLFNTEVDEVYAKSISSDIQDESALVTLKMSNGLLTSSIFSSKSTVSNEIEIYGHSGSLKISFYDIDGLEIRSGPFLPGRLSSLVTTPLQKIKQMAINTGVLIHGGIFKESYYREWDSFTYSVIYNKDPECNLEDGRRALRIALSAIESVSTKKPIYLF